ncbi:cytochrome P450 4C1-like isoform X2 [Toxorhynchites rutilus septentrionalis]|uniref:cytochrome P450 4C1-like isoform X2 n=1 Tax=Toxorhynchites rutilus septentrionalis TaxID=329112 RepID=UPI00247A1CA0|nr:cytochrome P450 4C1-like isoform X2 [Toxorhynchites rutilus septentrionalis]
MEDIRDNLMNSTSTGNTTILSSRNFVWSFRSFAPSSTEIFYIIDERTRRYPNIHRIWTGMTPEVRITKAEYVEAVIGASKHIEKSRGYKFLSEWLGEGLLTSKGERWFKHRKLITPTFHFNILNGFCDVFGENGSILAKRLDAFANTGQPVDVYPFITKAALDIICETAMGVNVNAQTDDDNEYVKAVYALSELFLERLVRPWLHPDMFFKLSQYGHDFDKALGVLHGYTKQVIRERKEALRQEQIGTGNGDPAEKKDVFGVKKRLAFLDLLLQGNEENNQLTDEDVREEVDTFMFEGHDTTTAGMSWALFLLGLHPDVQDKVHQELDSIFAGSDRPATMKDLNEMKLLERCLKETLRIFPSVAFFGRTLSEDITLGGYHIPARTIVGIQAYHVHRDERFFPDPEKFDPDRFLPENTENRHPYAYIPFSAGPRNCIGQKFALLEEKSLVSAVLRKFKVRSANTRDEQRINHELITRPKDGIRLYLERRD